MILKLWRATAIIPSRMERIEVFIVLAFVVGLCWLALEMEGEVR